MVEKEDSIVVVEDDIAVDQEYGLCLVGRVLTDSIVNFLSLKNALADLWHPLRGVQIHNLSIGFLTKGIAQQFRDFIGRFWEYDASLVTKGSRGKLLSSSINFRESTGEIWLGSVFGGCAKEERADGYSVNHLQHSFSDHCLVVVDTNGDRSLRFRKRQYQFHFNANWMLGLGSYPSYTWRSIWEAKQLLEEGVGWRMGDDIAVNIWNDAWLLRFGNGRVHFQNIDIRYSKVYDLIERESVTWKQDAICLSFGEEQLKRILLIPLASSEPHDALI
ncbi:hypothetical protein PVK06_026664 [Gossypium arboreum]|uniref:Reverse transcriptase n=1 Tax=Gossypium arboreum TaxID=29729 RepID=A0ABR0NYB0_GOSAR|nr:hypothetical protein PVK06_026664 [Gossypium arboreum]